MTLPVAIRERVPDYHAIKRALAGASGQRKRLVNLALTEAEALAWQSGMPDLVFLTLAEEKLDALEQWFVRQERMRGLSAQWSLTE